MDVQRQYTGTADRVENGQVAVDQALYQPESWTQIRPGAGPLGYPRAERSPPSPSCSDNRAGPGCPDSRRGVGYVLAVAISAGQASLSDVRICSVALQCSNKLICRACCSP